MEDQERMKAEQEGGSSVLEYLKSGDYVYNLYSILIHSGSAMGGHYYAYIKSFEDGNWYNFNDGTVSIIPPGQLNEEITAKYGGSASAYML
jgi:ubiquitin carboxyl-terminal hydrolase 47